MAYTINLTDGTIFATVADGTINTSSSMILVGKNYAGYGEFLDENFIHLLENGANTVAPGAPLVGQLWWDKSTNTMKVYNGTQFKVISASTASATAPTSNVAGDLWFDTTNQQLKAYNGTTFVLIGPASSSVTGNTGAIPNTIRDSVSVDHVVIEFYVFGTLVATMSKDAQFTPQTSIPGFATISPGLQLSTAVSNNLLRGTATNSQLLNSITSAQFLRSDENDTTSGTLGVINDSGLTVGLDQDARISVNTASSEVTLQNQTQDANLALKVNDGGSTTTVMLVNGATSVVNFPTSVTITGNLTAGNISTSGGGGGISVTTLTASGNITGGNILTSALVSAGNVSATGNVTGTGLVASGNVSGGNLIASGLLSVASITKTGTNAVGNIGSSTNSFNTVFAKSTSAEYADVAERFAADVEMEPGTVVELGGTAEITMSSTELSENVFGVISTRAAYLMNARAGSDHTHPPVAMTGRVPVKTIGIVRKGDRLVSAGSGLARAAAAGEATSFNVIGRALADKLTEEMGMVEAIVTIK